MKLDCIQKSLENIFYKYGKFIARYPLPFLLIPIITTFGFALGLYNFNLIEDTEYLYSPIHGRAKEERKIIEKYFPENATDRFLPSRKMSLQGFVQVLIKDKTGGNVYDNTHFDNIRDLNGYVEDVTVLHENQNYSYSTLCASWRGTCPENTLLTLTTSDPSIFEHTYYPFHHNLFLGTQLGGVAKDQHGYVKSAEAVLLNYFLQYETEANVIRSDLWIGKVKDLLLSYNNDYIDVYFQTSLSIEEELRKATIDIIPLFSVTYVVLCFFSVVTCMMLDWVRSKPWIAMGGQVSALLAITTSLGLLSAAGVPFSSPVASMPFLIIGICIDDMFVIISSWRHTDYRLSVEERMGQTFRLAAVSVTVTSITDALAFGVGSITHFQAVSLFCAYTGVAVLFSYVYAITFLAACLVYSGMREASNLHALTCKKVLPKEQAENRSMIYQLLCTGGYIPDQLIEKSHSKGLALTWMTRILSEKLAPFIMQKKAKIVILILYVIYMAFALWGCITLKEGLQLKNLVPDNSYVVPFYKNFDKYFVSKYGRNIMVAFTGRLDYSKVSIQNDINSILEGFRKNAVFIDDERLTESWLGSFLTFLSQNHQEANDLGTVIHLLRTQFFVLPQYERFTTDVSFNSDYTKIEASRFLLLSSGIASSVEERELMTESRDLADVSGYDITTYHPGFIYFEQYTVIFENTVQNLSIAVGSMMVISLFLLPSLLSVLWVTLSVSSICTGVVGYMVFWDVSLEFISMINLIMCIGFSVNFSAHISYHFTISSEKTGDAKAIDAVGHLGTPIVQGAVSTILGVLVLIFSDSYIFRTFFKIVFLVMVLGFFHAMFVLPVILSLLGPGGIFSKQKMDKSELKVCQIDAEEVIHVSLDVSGSPS